MCTPTLPDGESCTTGNQCRSTFCVDTVCCNRLCDGPMEVCNLQGQQGTCLVPTAPAPTTSRTGLLMALGMLVAVAAVALGRRRRGILIPLVEGVGPALPVGGRHDGDQ